MKHLMWKGSPVQSFVVLAQCLLTRRYPFTLCVRRAGNGIPLKNVGVFRCDVFFMAAGVVMKKNIIDCRLPFSVNNYKDFIYGY